jgi:hypothetical protein
MKCLIRIRVLVLCLLAFSPAARSRERSNPLSQQENVAIKQQLKPEEPEANTSAGTEALQKATQNPVASLISVPVKNNNNFGINPGYRTQDVLNIQPVVPIGISKDWNLLVRWIMPIVWQPLPNQPSTPETGVYGLGDMTPTFFLSPKKPGKIIWGAGPVLQLPTATSSFLGQGKLGLGPSVVVLTQPGHWTLGVLANNVWSVAGSGSRPDVNQFLLQYFINYNLSKGWYITWQPTLTANWEAPGGSQWVVPFGGGVGRITKLGFQPVVPHSTILWQCRPPRGYFVLDHALTNRVSLSQVNQGTATNAVGEEIKTDATGATSHEVNEFPARPVCARL